MKHSSTITGKVLRLVSALLFVICVFCQVTYPLADELIDTRNASIERINNPSESYPVYAYAYINPGRTLGDVYSICRTGNSGKHFHMSLGMIYWHKNDASTGTEVWKECRTSSSTGLNEMSCYHSCSSPLKKVLGRFSVNDCYRYGPDHGDDFNINYTSWWTWITVEDYNP